MTDRELIEDAREQAEGFSGKSGCVYTSEFDYKKGKWKNG